MARSHLLKELDELLVHDYISTEQHEEIQEYLLRKKAKPLTTIPILPLIGVLLICSGIIAIAASNWVYFPLPLKLFMAFAPLILASIALMVTKERNSPPLTECLALAVGMLELLAFGIISNLYQTPVSTEYLMQVVIGSLIPVVYCYKTYWLTAVLLTGVLYGADSNYLLLSLLGLVAFVPFTLARIRKEEPIRLLTLLHLVATFRFVLLLSNHEVPLLILYGFITLLSLFYREEFFQSLVHKANSVLLLVLSVESGILWSITDSYLPVVLSYILCAMILLGYSYVQYRDGALDFSTAKRFGMYGIALLMTILPLQLITVVLILMSLSYDSIFYYKEGNLKKYNQKSALLSVFVLFQMFCLQFPFMVNGILFIIAGLGFLITSLSLSRKNERGDTDESIK